MREEQLFSVQVIVTCVVLVVRPTRTDRIITPRSASCHDVFSINVFEIGYLQKVRQTEVLDDSSFGCSLVVVRINTLHNVFEGVSATLFIVIQVHDESEEFLAL